MGFIPLRHLVDGFISLFNEIRRKCAMLNVYRDEHDPTRSRFLGHPCHHHLDILMLEYLKGFQDEGMVDAIVFSTGEFRNDVFSDIQLSWHMLDFVRLKIC